MLLARVLRWVQAWIRPSAAGVILLGLAAGAAPGEPREVLVKMRGSGPGPRLASGVDDPGLPAGARVLSSLPLPGWQVVELAPGMDLREGVRWFRRRPGVVAAEANHRYSLHAVPDDPDLVRLQGLDQIGAPAAWQTSTGSSNIVVAVVDTGVDATHPDLLPNLWRNPGEVPGNGRDDDGNGWVDDVFGVDVADGDGDPTDDAGHGTHVAGTIGAAGNNTRGVAGVCWQVRILSVRVGAVDGFGTTAEIVRGFDYLVRMKRRGVNIRVANCSWGGAFPSAAMKEAIAQAAAEGILVVCSAGNEGQDNDAIPNYPAGYDVPEILVAAASTACDLPWSVSNHGRTTVDLAAPGVGILSTFPRGERYAVLSGTSMASPHVSGAAALALSVRPGLSTLQLRSLLLGTVEPQPAWSGRIAGGGRLDVARALDRLASGSLPPEPVPAPPTGRVSLASAAPSGRWGDGPSDSPALSGDGRWVAFRSSATNLVAGDVEGFEDIFLQDRLSNTVVRVSQGSAGRGGNGDSRAPVVSADGRFVAFVSAASNLGTGTLDLNAGEDVYLWDRVTRGVELVSVRSDGRAAGNLPSDQPALSADGSVVAFLSEARDLVAGDRNGAGDVFVRDRARRVTERVSVGPQGVEATDWSEAPSLSADGRFVAFHSDAANLVAGDANGAADVFVRDRTTGTTQRVSVRSDGVAGDGDSVYPVVSGDGRWVLFSSVSENLDALPSGGWLGLYLHDRTTGRLVRVGVPADGSSPAGDSYPDGLSADGRFITFTSDDGRLGAGGAPGVFRVLGFDRLTGGVEELVLSEAGYPTEDGAIFGRPSSDGRWVAFASFGFNLVPGDGNGLADVFVVDRGAGRPDLVIRGAGEAARVGMGIRHPRVPQRSGRTVAVGDGTGYRVELVNAGEARSFVLRMDRASAPGWEARVTGPDGSLDLTAALAGGGWQTPVVPAGSNLVFQLGVRRVSASGERVFAVQVTAGGGESGAAWDAVSAVTETRLPPPGPRLVSRGQAGGPASRNAELGRASGDGRWVAFSSEADRLMASGDTNFQADVFVADLETGVLIRASDASATDQANADSRYPMLSADGRRVAFQSRANNLVPSDGNDVEDIFVRDLDGSPVGGPLRRVNVTAAGVAADRGSESAFLAGGGRQVAFTSFAGNLVPGDTNRAQDVYVKDLETGALEWASRGANGNAGDADSEGGVLSADGRFVVFTSLASNLVTNDGGVYPDVFLRDRATGALVLISASTNGAAGNGPSGGPAVSDDGRWVTFFSYATDLAPGAVPGESRPFVLDRQDGSLRAVADVVGPLPGDLQVRRAAVSPDGRWFLMAGTPRCGQSGFSQVLVQDRVGGGIRVVSALRGGEWGDDHAAGTAITPGGRFVVFETGAENLLGERGMPADQVFLADLADPATGGWVRRMPDGSWRQATPAADGAVPTTLVQVGGVGGGAGPSGGAGVREFTSRIVNRGSHPDRFLVRIQSKGGAWVPGVLVFAETTPPEEITAGVSGAGWRTPELPAGGEVEVRLLVAPAATPGSDLEFQWSAESVSDPARRQTAVLRVEADTDRDGIPDGWERQWFGGLAVSGPATDADLDRVTDVEEWVAGTVPTDPGSGLRAIAAGPGVVRWGSVQGRYYSVERAAAVGGPYAVVPLSVREGTGQGMEWVDREALGGGGVFHRIRVDLP